MGRKTNWNRVAAIATLISCLLAAIFGVYQISTKGTSIETHGDNSPVIKNNSGDVNVDVH
ncbi:hypothetical protein [Neptunomonas sp.]|uniref:hypothetical protein n=1 Tax=Neptunomonas sp. TaxID=1971898 RepID=UPI0035675AD6